MAFANKPPSRKNSSLSQAGDADWFHRTSMGFSNIGAPTELAQNQELSLQPRNADWTEFLMSQSIEAAHKPREVVDESTWFKIRTRDLREFSLDSIHHPETEAVFHVPKERGDNEHQAEGSAENMESLIRRNFSRSLSGFLNISETASLFGQPLTRAVSQADLGKFVQIMSELNRGGDLQISTQDASQAEREIQESPIKAKKPDFTKVFAE